MMLDEAERRTVSDWLAVMREHDRVHQVGDMLADVRARWRAALVNFRVLAPDDRVDPALEEMLEAVEGWCVDVLITASQSHGRRTGRYLSAAEVRRVTPSVKDILTVKGGSRARLSTWVNGYGLTVRQAVRLVQPTAAERAIAALAHNDQLDTSSAAAAPERRPGTEREHFA